MTRFAIDSSTLIHLVDHGVRVAGEHQLVAPASVRSDALQLLLDDVRAGARTEHDVRAVHEALTARKIRLLGDRVSRMTAWRLAQDLGLGSLRLAECLAIAQLQADALVTVDPELRRVALDVVPLAPVSALGAEAD